MKVQKMLTLDDDLVNEMRKMPNASAWANDVLKSKLHISEMTEAQLEAELKVIELQEATEAKIKEIRLNAK